MTRDTEAVYAFTQAAALVRMLHEAGQPINVDLWLDAIREQVDAATDHAPGCRRDEQAGVCYCATQAVVA